MKRSLLATAVFAVTLSASAHAANIVQNGDFSTGDFSHWTLTGDSEFSYVFTSPGTTAAALTTDTDDIDHITQTITDIAGQRYTFSFEYQGDGATPNSFSATVGGSRLFSTSNIPDTIPAFITVTSTFTGSGSDVVDFGFDDAPGYIYLTDVSATLIPPTGPTVTPEPSGLVLLGTGILAAASTVRRRLNF